jgi:hypothetical protein
MTIIGLLVQPHCPVYLENEWNALQSPYEKKGE